MTRISVVGQSGNMAKSVLSALKEREAYQIDEVFSSKNIVTIDKLKQSQSEILIDCTLSEVFLNNIESYLQAGKKVIVATSNWYQHIDKVQELVSKYNGILLYSQNFAIGNYLYKKIIQDSCELFANLNDFQPSLYEEHHINKKDFPSAVANEITQIVLNKYNHRISKAEISPQNGKPKDNIFYTSILRRGQNTINHSFFLTSEFEDIEIIHRVRSRDCFTQGILAGIDFISNQNVGIYNMDDLVDWIQK